MKNEKNFPAIKFFPIFFFAVSAVLLHSCASAPPPKPKEPECEICKNRLPPAVPKYESKENKIFREKVRDACYIDNSSVSYTAKESFDKALIEKWNQEFEWRDTTDGNVWFGGLGKQADNVLEESLKNDSSGSYKNYMIMLALAGRKKDKKDKDGAVSVLSQHKDRFPSKTQDIEELISILSENDNAELTRPEDLGAVTADEYSPVPNLTENRLLFTAFGKKGGIWGEDLWVSEYSQETKKWSPPSLFSDISTDSHEASLDISSDGTEIYAFGNYPGGPGGGDIFKTEQNWAEQKWNMPKALPSPINTNCFESDIAGTPDKKYALFVSDRPGGLYEYHPKNTMYAGNGWGNTDIYIFEIKEDGTFGEPKSLGPMINTPGAERTPFLHPDGKTLYFSSDGHNGFGGLDLFKSERLDDTWQNWSKPVNLGRSLNSSSDNWGFRASVKTETGYISSGTADSEFTSIQKVSPLPERAKPFGSTVIVKGRIADKKGRAVSAVLTFKDKKTGRTIGVFKNRLKTGEFEAPLPIGGKYVYEIKTNNYKSSELNADLSRNRSFAEVPLKLPSVPSDGPKNLTSFAILFAGGRDKILADSASELEEAVTFIQKNHPDSIIEIQGYTAKSLGVPESENIRLSKKRAESILNHLVKKGFKKEKFKTVGMGSANPAAENTSEEGRQQNRRAVFEEKK